MEDKETVCCSFAYFDTQTGGAISWEQRKLGDLGKARSGIGFPDAEQGGKEGVPFYKVSDMNNAGNEHEMVTANNYVTREQIVRKGWKPIDEVPAIFFAKVGAAIMLNRKRLCRTPFLLDNNTMAYSMDGSVLDGDFAKTLFETIDLTSLVQVGALPSYNSGDVENIDAVIPEMNEQKAIGSYFKSLDHLIALHQRKCFSLKILCRYEIFITWEQRKLGEIADHVIEKNLSLVEHETFTNSAEFGIVSQMDFFDHGITNEENIGNYYIVHPEDFVYNPRISVTAPVGPINRNKLGRNGVMSPLYTVFRPHDIDNTYLEYYFKADGWHSFMRFNGDTGARSDRFSIKTELFYEMPILIPKLEEQNAIGRFLRNLSELIALHQRKANPLKILVYRSDFFDSF